MKTKLILCAISSLLLFACGNKDLKEDAVFDPKEVGTSEVIKQSNDILAEADRIFMRENYLVELYIEDSTKTSLQKVDNFENIPAGLVATYNIIRYKSGEIMYVAEFPYCKTNEWENIYESLFDETGNLLKFVRKSSFFEANMVVAEKSEYYYNAEHDLLKKTYERKDQNNKAIPDEVELKFQYRFPYAKYTSRAEWLEAHGLAK